MLLHHRNPSIRAVLRQAQQESIFQHVVIDIAEKSFGIDAHGFASRKINQSQQSWQSFFFTKFDAPDLNF